MKPEKMHDGPQPQDSARLPVILIAAVVQGWALYGLHLALKGPHWPATQSGWLMALYALATFVPLTAQLLAEQIRQRAAWIILATLAVAFSYFGWHSGAAVMDSHRERFFEEWAVLTFEQAVLWLLMLPFIQARLADGQWWPRYAALFTNAWRNTLTLAEAALFTGLFWLLLFLWAQLFEMLGIGFFEELFEEPIFVYPITSLVFGIALHLIGSIERLTSAVLEQLLNVLKWLATVAGLILALFTIALAFKLPGMIASGERAIGAAWLLWLVAVTVLLVNAAYRDGSVEQPYPRFVALALRLVVPLTGVIALTALYATYLRIDAFGFTVQRVWALIVALAALVYSVGYALAARHSDRWMASVAKINIATAVLLIVVLALALTPLLSPYRIAASSQFQQALHAASTKTKDGASRQSALNYLRFDAGGYGIAKLEQLMTLQDHPHAAEIRRDAQAARAEKNRWEARPAVNLKASLDQLRLQPGRTVNAELRAVIESSLKGSYLTEDEHLPVPGGVFVDLDRDGREEFVLALGGEFFAYTQDPSATWRQAGFLVSQDEPNPKGLLDQMLQGDMQVREPRWQELQIGETIFELQDNP